MDGHPRKKYEVTRFIFTPTGHAHIGHAWTAYVNWMMARTTGGRFGYRFETVLAMVGGGAEGAALRAPVQEGGHTLAEHYAYENLADMEALGLKPTPGYVRMHQYNAIADWYWNLLDFEPHFGSWPGERQEGANTPPCVAMLETFAVHPYIALERVVGDIEMGCTAVIRGEDLKEETRDYMKFAHMVVGHRKERIPHLEYIPVLKRSASNAEGLAAYHGAAGLSSSDSQSIAGMKVRDVLDAGIPPSKLFDYLEKVYMGRPGIGREQPWRYGLVVEIATHAEAPMTQYPIVHDEDWERFLATGEVGE